jgi:hypothetical protein
MIVVDRGRRHTSTDSGFLRRAYTHTDHTASSPVTHSRTITPILTHSHSHSPSLHAAHFECVCSVFHSCISSRTSSRLRISRFAFVASCISLPSPSSRDFELARARAVVCDVQRAYARSVARRACADTCNHVPHSLCGLARNHRAYTAEQIFNLFDPQRRSNPCVRCASEGDLSHSSSPRSIPLAAASVAVSNPPAAVESLPSWPSDRSSHGTVELSKWIEVESTRRTRGMEESEKRGRTQDEQEGKQQTRQQQQQQQHDFVNRADADDCRCRSKHKLRTQMDFDMEF